MWVLEHNEREGRKPNYSSEVDFLSGEKPREEDV